MARWRGQGWGDRWRARPEYHVMEHNARAQVRYRRRHPFSGAEQAWRLWMNCFLAAGMLGGCACAGLGRWPGRCAKSNHVTLKHWTCVGAVRKSPLQRVGPYVRECTFMYQSHVD